MTSLLRRQGTYKEGLSAREGRATATKLARSSFLGRDPTGAKPIPRSLWEEDELSERGTLLKDVQDTVWDYLRVHLPRILGPVVLTRVQQQEWTYKKFPELKESLHNERMPWGEYQEVITNMLPKGTGLYVLSKVLTLRRES